MTPWLFVVGVGEDGLDGLPSSHRALIDSAEVLVGGERLLAMVPAGKAERITWSRPFADSFPAIAAQRGRMVVALASGDPLWFGAGASLLDRFTIEDMTILPTPGAFSLAAARLGWPLAGVETISLAARPLAQLNLFLAPGIRILALSQDGTTPAQAAVLLREAGWGPSRFVLLERLGGERERIVEGTAENWLAERCNVLNTIAIECRPGPGAKPRSRTAGLPDEAFSHDGQITKQEVRAATLAALAPLPGALLWDIGAGCGSIGIEWSRAARDAQAIAIERDESRRALIAANATGLGVPGLRIVAGAAPGALAKLPAPDAVFIGGGIGDPGLVEAAWAALKPRGRLVANAVTVAGEAEVAAARAAYGGELVRLQVSRAEKLGDHLAWRPLLPVTQWAATKD